MILNGKPAKLFRSGSLTVLDLLMMNGYTSADLVGRTGRSLSVTVDGQRLTFRGESAAPCVLRRNGEDARPSALVYAGDSIEFTPAVVHQEIGPAVRLAGQYQRLPIEIQEEGASGGRPGLLRPLPGRRRLRFRFRDSLRGRRGADSGHHLISRAQGGVQRRRAAIDQYPAGVIRAQQVPRTAGPIS